MSPLEQLEARIVSLTADINGTRARLIFLIEEFDRRRGYEAWGFESTAKWLAWRCELSPGTAREQVRVARVLRSLPMTAAALRGGEIPFSRVRAISRAATPDNERVWLDRARVLRTEDLEREIRDERNGQLREDPSLQARERRMTMKTGADAMTIG